MFEGETPVYWVIPKYDFVAEHRIFNKGEKYPVYARDYEYTLVGENGSFNFTDIGFKRLMKAWKPDVDFEEVTDDVKSES
ncbi:hypothetical protein GPK34_01060 [Secundilactobacillus kimchicus]|uniref:hypothetical protein n=1 Tax=Secundilactobacillus kimchicus TaxID=528209 RepID=UPI001C020F29|nr:hypothetical protein [Secundilactobacillus kimchicus]MBT9670627.1 hypothetical protein [Secundilactobacillus kimchicus]